MYILGISGFYHDSAACIVKDGEIVAAAQEERFTRKKHDHEFPSNAIKYCLKESGIDSAELDFVAFYEKPFIKFERILETYLAFAPIGIKSFLKAMPLWIKKKLWIKEIIKDELKNSGKNNNIIEKIATGKLNKFIMDNTLLNQEWIIDPKKKVKDVINENSDKDKIEIKNFVRFKVGEGL